MIIHQRQNLNKILSFSLIKILERIEFVIYAEIELCQAHQSTANYKKIEKRR